MRSDGHTRLVGSDIRIRIHVVTNDHTYACKLSFNCYMGEEAKPYEITAHNFNTKVYHRDIQSLRDRTWVNDEVLNFYLKVTGGVGVNSCRW